MSPRLDCDVLVAGAGPAGSMAALTLSRAGRKVLLLEKKAFPRSKPCGGCLSRRAERLLPPAFLDEVVESRITRARFIFRQRESREYCFPQPAAYMVRREVFDARLAREAETAGAEAHYGTPVSSFQVSSDFVQSETGLGTIRSRFLILAHGAYPLGRTPQPGRRPPLTYHALEARLDQSELTAPWPRDTVAIHLGTVKFGYGWTFPCGEGLSVGQSFWPPKERHPRQSQIRFINGLTHLKTRPRLKGHPIPCYDGRPVAYSSGRVLRVGDAARLVEPFLGEGIYYALWSGRAGAEAVTAALRSDRPDLGAYDQSLAGHILPEFEYALRLARWVYAQPGLFWWLLKKHPGIMTIYFSILQGQESYGRFFWECKKKIRQSTGLQWILGEPQRKAFP